MEITKSFDGTLKIKIPHLGITTWARDLEDACVAIEEACLLHQLIKLQYSSA